MIKYFPALLKKQTFLLFLSISFSKLCTFIRSTATRTQMFFKVCRCMSLYLSLQGKTAFVYIFSGNLKLQGIIITLYYNNIIFTKTDFQISSKLLPLSSTYLNSFSIPQMKPFANISRTKGDDPKYNKLLHSDSLPSSKVFLSNLKST